MPAGPFVWAVWSLYEATIVACLSLSVTEELLKLKYFGLTAVTPLFHMRKT